VLKIREILERLVWPTSLAYPQRPKQKNTKTKAPKPKKRITQAQRGLRSGLDLTNCTHVEMCQKFTAAGSNEPARNKN